MLLLNYQLIKMPLLRAICELKHWSKWYISSFGLPFRDFPQLNLCFVVSNRAVGKCWFAESINNALYVYDIAGVRSEFETCACTYAVVAFDSIHYKALFDVNLLRSAVCNFYARQQNASRVLAMV